MSSTLEIVAQPGGSVVQLRLNVDINAEPWASLLKSGRQEEVVAALQVAQQRQAELEAQVAMLHEQLQDQALQNEVDNEALWDENAQLRQANAALQQQNQYLLQAIEQLNAHALRQPQPAPRPEVPVMLVAPAVTQPAPAPEVETAPVPRQATLAAQPRPTWEPPVYSHTGEPEPDPYAGQRICNHEEDIEPDVSFGFAHSVSRFINRVQVSLGVTPDFAREDY